MKRSEYRKTLPKTVKLHFNSLLMSCRKKDITVGGMPQLKFKPKLTKNTVMAMALETMLITMYQKS